jgi:hypothetical protein
MPAAGGLPMIVREIVLTCSNPHVARAAVASIGGDFARAFSRDAASRNLSSGLLASHLVRHFARRAADADWEGLDEATRGADQPILSGLRYILDRGLELVDDDSPPREGWTSPRPPLSCGEAWRNCA